MREHPEKLTMPVAVAMQPLPLHSSTMDVDIEQSLPLQYADV
jgi:hypothetical protein